MARTNKRGLDYFPFDIDFFQDIRIRKLIKYQSGKAITVYALLLCNIYRNGYYVEWDKELPFIISEQSGYTEAYIQEVIDCCMNIGLFSKELFESAKVLTSRGIQERYLRICTSLRRNVRVSEYSLISVPNGNSANSQAPVTDEKPKAPPRKPRQKKEDSPKDIPKESPKPQPMAEPQPLQTPSPQTPQQSGMLLADEIKELKKADSWLEAVGMRYSRSIDEVRECLDNFALVCTKDRHPSLQDCKSHFCRWLAKQPVNKPSSASTPPTDYGFNGGFGGKDV